MKAMRTDEVLDYDVLVDMDEMASLGITDADPTSVPRIRTINLILVVIATVAAIVAISLLTNIIAANARSEAARDRYDECVSAVRELMEASDYLTTESRMYSLTGDVQYLNGYLEELDTAKHRDQAVETLQREVDDQEAADRLVSALAESNQLAELELYAMRIMADATGVDPLPADLQAVTVSPEDNALSNDQKRALSAQMLVGVEYEGLKNLIVNDVEASANELLSKLEVDKAYRVQVSRGLHTALFIIIGVLTVLIVIAAYANYTLVQRPMRIHAKNIRDNEPLEPLGSQEMRYVVNAYNQIYAENHRRTLLLKREAETDALTGLLNRGSYNKLLKHYGKNIALVIIDVDMFKQVNDTYGHDVGDKVLKRVADATHDAFRSTDYVCRIGGDEFAVIMTETDPDKRSVIASKLDMIFAAVADEKDDVPAVTLSAGVAFSALLTKDDQDIYNAADKALYEAKRSSRNCYRFFGE